MQIKNLTQGRRSTAGLSVAALVHENISPEMVTIAVSGATGGVLATLIKSLVYGGTVTTCGMINGGDLHTTVFPFILKGVKLIGIDSVEVPMKNRLPVWKNLAGDWRPET